MKNQIKSTLLLLVLLFAVNSRSSAQISSITIGVDGFTCSLCAKGVEEQFKSLDFVQSVKTYLKKTEFVLTFKQNQKIVISKIRDAVNDGGFTVRDVKIEAKGMIKGNPDSGYYLIAPEIPEIPLKDVSGKFSDGDKVSVKGIVNSSVSNISVTSIKKL
jgi:mercuric ion binding protein